MILPHKFMVSDFGEGVRKFLTDKKAVESILHFEAEMVFQDASTYTCILGMSKTDKASLSFKKLHPKEILDELVFHTSDYESFDSGKWNLKSNEVEKIFKKISSQPFIVKDIFSAIRVGIDSGDDDMFQLQGKLEGNLFRGHSKKLDSEIILEKELVKPILKGENVKKYAPLNTSYFMLYPHYEDNGKTKPISEDDLKNNYPRTYEYISKFKDEQIERKLRKKTNPKYWYSLHRSREISIFEQEKIVTPETSLGTNLTYDNKHNFHNTQVYSLIKSEDSEFEVKTLLAILNSPLFWFFLKSTGAVLRGGYFRYKTKYLEPFPIPEVPSTTLQAKFLILVDEMLELNITFNKVSNSFKKLVKRKFEIEKLSTKLKSWHTLAFAEFTKELKKKKVKLGLAEEAEWEEYFDAEKAKAQAIQMEIDKTDREIDAMVYELYGLTEEEIGIVENS